MVKREFADGHRGTETRRMRGWPEVWALNLQINFVTFLVSLNANGDHNPCWQSISRRRRFRGLRGRSRLSNGIP